MYLPTSAPETLNIPGTTTRAATINHSAKLVEADISWENVMYMTDVAPAKQPVRKHHGTDTE